MMLSTNMKPNQTKDESERFCLINQNAGPKPNQNHPTIEAAVGVFTCSTHVWATRMIREQ